MNPFSWIQDLIFPNSCVGCETELVNGENAICRTCLHKIELTNFHTNPKNNPVYRKLAGKVPIAGAFSCFYFDDNGLLQRILHKLKYEELPKIGVELGLFYAEQLNQFDFSNYKALIPVPLHPAKLRKRGYNQAEQIAYGLSLQLKIPVRTDCLAKITPTESQTKKSRLERWLNVQEVFQSTKQDLPDTIILVDDVITTGATLEAACQALLTQKPELQILILTIATPR
ncbi:MAG: phosphoribosyltransferase family protein [Bacteroidia bacterium]|nr:phosphoribosyltransferase family protein [Bacteroidia bacterium]